MSELIIETDPLHTIGELIRCDDCIYRDGKTPGQPNILCWQMHSDDYCSYGTKREIGTYCEDIVTVVRCKDCKWFSANEHPQIPIMCQSKYEDGSSIYGTCLYATRIYPKPTDFCSWGERREDG